MQAMLTRSIVTSVLNLSVVFSPSAPAQNAWPSPASATEGIQITVYNQDLAVVKDRRHMEIPKGTGPVRFTDVATRIDATSVHFESLSDPEGTRVLEQNFEYDLVSPTKLLDKYLDAEVSLFTKDNGVYAGTLLSQAEGKVVIRDSEGKLQLVNGGDNLLRVELPKLPEGLITRPTLVWQTLSAPGGNQLCQVTYMTGGISWKSDYVMVVNDQDDKVDLTGWVTLDNQSGVTYRDARLKLVAGDVNRVQEDAVPQVKMMALAMEARAPADAGFEEKAFFEYHLYTLQRPTTVANAQTKQVELLTAAAVPAKKVFLYNGSRNGKKVEVKMEFRNSKENHMGMALPKGKVRAFKADSDGSLEFVGEDQIDHTPKDEDLRILLGNAFDLVGERSQIDQKQVSGNLVEQSYKISLRNHKQEPVTIKVVEPQWGDWKVTKSSHPHNKKDAKTLEFDIPVPADGSVDVLYTVQVKTAR